MLKTAVSNNLDAFLSRKDFAPFPKYGNPAWKTLPREASAVIIGRAEFLAEEPWEVLPASRFMDFAKNGNRVKYEKVYFDRRRKLRTLVAAECMEQKGRFLEHVIDGVWAMCEESTWALPAHMGDRTGPADALLDVEKDLSVLDLFAAETAATLAWTLYLMEDVIRETCIHVPGRIEYEIERRVLRPFADRDDFGWMGLSDDNPVNNWNPWINENVLASALVAARDESLRTRVIEKVSRSAQRFLDFYADDGGCDEGPSYFGVAGASMMDILELCALATGGKIDLFQSEKVKSMADYIRHVHVAGDYFVNFADAPATIPAVNEETLIRAAKRSGNPALADFARMRLREKRDTRPDRYFTDDTYYMTRALASLFDWDEGSYSAAKTVASKGFYFGGIQVATARTRENDFSGLFLAAKAGHNDESHNHNDVGNFILYASGMPAIVDAGVGEYTKKTFSKDRYDIWTMQSGWHNTLRLNGCDQVAGREHAAENVCYCDDGRVLEFALDMGGAYGSEAAVLSARRCFRFDREENVITVTDRVQCADAIQAHEMPLILADRPCITPGRVTVNGLAIEYDAEQFNVFVEEKKFNDPKLERAWSRDGLYRLRLVRKEARKEDGWVIRFRKK